jgi:hypothetical protein
MVMPETVAAGAITVAVCPAAVPSAAASKDTTSVGIRIRPPTFEQAANL